MKICKIGFFIEKCTILVILLNYINPVFASNKYVKERTEASRLLKFVRNKRANSVGEEYFTSSSLQRECYEETCDYEEAKEYFENYSNDGGAKIAKLFMEHNSIKKCQSDRGLNKCDAMCQAGWSGEYCENLEANSTMIIRDMSIGPKDENIEANSTMIIRDKPKDENIEANSKIISIVDRANFLSNKIEQPNYVCSWVGEIGTKRNEWRGAMGGSVISDIHVKYNVPANKRGKWYLVASFLEPVSRIIWWSTPLGADPPRGNLDGHVWILKPECTWYFNKNVDFSMQLVSSFSHQNRAMQFHYCYRRGESCDKLHELKELVCTVHATAKFSVWRSLNLDSSGYIRLGHIGRVGLSKISPGVNVQFMNSTGTVNNFTYRNGKKAYTMATGFDKIWDDDGAHIQKNNACWTPRCQNGYKPISDIFSTDGDTPSNNETYCVIDQMVKASTAEKLIWRDTGSGALHDLLVYKLVDNEFIRCYNPQNRKGGNTGYRIRVFF